jgi:hypothetical protein
LEYLSAWTSKFVNGLQIFKMPKTATFTTITALPSGVTRKSVQDMFQDHLAMIDLNPLVVERFRCRPPSYATTDEYYQAWYTIKGMFSRVLEDLSKY